MSDDPKRKGRCLCGSVTFTLPEVPHEVDACHCDMCRRWHGTPGMALSPVKDLSIQGEEFVTVYRSSEWAERAFCSKCGSCLYYHLLPDDSYVTYAGLLDDQSGLTMPLEIFVDEKPDFYAFAGDAKKMTGEEAIAMFTAKMEGGE